MRLAIFNQYFHALWSKKWKWYLMWTVMYDQGTVNRGQRSNEYIWARKSPIIPTCKSTALVPIGIRKTISSNEVLYSYPTTPNCPKLVPKSILYEDDIYLKILFQRFETKTSNRWRWPRYTPWIRNKEFDSYVEQKLYFHSSQNNSYGNSYQKMALVTLLI